MAACWNTSLPPQKTASDGDGLGAVEKGPNLGRDRRPEGKDRSCG